MCGGGRKIILFFKKGNKLCGSWLSDMPNIPWLPQPELEPRPSDIESKSYLLYDLAFLCFKGMKWIAVFLPTQHPFYCLLPKAPHCPFPTLRPFGLCGDNPIPPLLHGEHLTKTTVVSQCELEKCTLSSRYSCARGKSVVCPALDLSSCLFSLQ